MKIIQVPRRFVLSEWGGTETTILQTSRALQQAGHEAAIFTSLALSDQRRESIAGVPVRRFPYSYPFFGLSAADRRDMDRKGGNLLSLSLLLGLLREPGVDILHAHTGKRVGGLVRTAARLRGIPYVVTLHGGFFAVPKGEMEQMLAPIRNTFEWGRAFGALLGARRVLEDADAVICVGGDEYAAAKARLPDKRVELIPNGVDCDAFAQGDAAAFRAAHGIAPERRILLCVSRIDYQKNQIGLVEALARVTGPIPQAHLVLIGPVTVAGYRDRLMARIEELGLGDRVTLVPGLRPDDPLLAGAYHAAEVFCLPSLHEPFGIVILEAWAAGRPVVASRVGGIPSFTQDGDDILLAEPGDSADLAARLLQVLQDQPLAARIAEAGRIKARRDYAWSAIAARLLEIYRELPRGRARGTGA
ncbi:glycosyltransferase family 4 protein [Thiohalocapsa marina]|uniref:Glycosyltransferase family 4 protein n=1 Tax=Thiohalocapsa marina TaxID=424902 RepID=A0A5M8FJ24_9GAMM|nr:glycosyltransferase family 4 protein [Thiohalocapsa marina]KAA6183171.1 glycosyltransferase family 4 protein [Thiohalocapsa marina]